MVAAGQPRRESLAGVPPWRRSRRHVAIVVTDRAPPPPIPPPPAHSFVTPPVLLLLPFGAGVGSVGCPRCRLVDVTISAGPADAGGGGSGATAAAAASAAAATAAGEVGAAAVRDEAADMIELADWEDGDGDDW